MAANQQSSSHQQHQPDRHLCNHQRALPAVLPAAPVAPRPLSPSAVAGPANMQIESDFYDKCFNSEARSARCAPAMGGVGESLRKARLSAGSAPCYYVQPISARYGDTHCLRQCPNRRRCVSVLPYVTSYNGHQKISRREIWSLYSAAVINQRMDYLQQKLFNR
jgi:hypothetical protein